MKELIRYKIQREDTLESIAAKHGLSIKELVTFHNQSCGVTETILNDYLPLHLEHIFLEIKTEEKQQKSNNTTTSNKARYRAEQTVITKINGIIQNHADTKREFFVIKEYNNSKLLIKTALVENIIKINPMALQDAMNIICEVDLLKCDAILEPDLKTGKIKKVRNHDEIIKRWKKYRNNLESKFGFIRSDTTKNDFKRFIDASENVIINEENLKTDFNAKLFFDLFFDKYLVSKDNLFDSFNKKLNSQLLENIPVELKFRQDILSETEDTVTVRKVGELNKNSLNIDGLKKSYEERYLPIVGYKFSEYNFSMREHTILDVTNQWIEDSEVTIIEEVKNNVQILISYKLKKIET
ncbi:LysM domain-containing protein [Chryseobacterium camelliae]|uniref:LysM domain-containing protein n=1 Tax=Chryseobacterium camelliae TaxID=1265445 RepID=A0ABY7QKB4_9FLAO|nr:LysM domain-containing protein [Chryseobacterium camelliae]WBV60079.1 LysM domain-containing protein [Chryseobacterium camelliae]